MSMVLLTVHTHLHLRSQQGLMKSITNTWPQVKRDNCKPIAHQAEREGQSNSEWNNSFKY